MVNKEILTLQFGHYSNFVGTHWWNLQERSFQYNADCSTEINHDVLYREGLTNQKQVTFTPRLLLVDLQGSLGTLPERGDLYEKKVDINQMKQNFSGNQVEQIGTTKTKNKFQQDLDEDNIKAENYNFEQITKVWSDFLYGRLHPRTIELVKSYEFSNENTPFDAFPLGTNCWKSAQFSEDFSDKIRNYVEECDYFQGFHCLTDCTNAFSGLSSSCIEYIRDEYDRKSILVLPVIPGHFSDNDFSSDEEKAQSAINDSVRTLNLALCFNEFNNNSSLFVPLSVGSKGWRQPGPKRVFNHVVYDHKLAYHSSAILAAALDTLTLKYRLQKSNFTLSDLSVDLTHSGRKAVSASIQFPFPLKENSDLLELLDHWEGSLTQSLTPNCSIGTRRVMQHLTLRGIKENCLKKPPEKAGKQRELPAYRCRNLKEMLEMYLAYSTEATASNVTIDEESLTVKNPFPQIFDKNINSCGFISEQQKTQSEMVESIPLLTGLHNDSQIGNMLENLHTEARRIKFNRFHQFLENGISKDDYEECMDNLFTLRENYEDNYVI